MPELPEVETIRRQLAPRLEGRRILGAQILDARWTRPQDPAAVAAGLRGRVIAGLERRGKYLVWRLDDERFLLVHLRMTGTLLVDPPVEPPHTRVRIALEGGVRLVYDDPRRFGTGHLLVGSDELDRHLDARLGVEPLTPQFTAAHLRALARGRRAPIKSFILDQRRIAGVGNIYADEALHLAGIHPLRPAGSLRGAQIEALREAIVRALQSGIDARGATIDDFRHVDGARGSFQDRFRVHRREGLPCPRCGTAIVKLVVGGRGSYVCERCQPRPRRSAVRPRAGSSAAPRDRPPAAPESRPGSGRRSRSAGT
ncbi:MAG TPA: bifunctional DNA-formamidopyrimidine glycosylase/DNA-(apurinic or apyrimidinic site) lyase [Solirubrobacteraceae bacterium]|nr:bifunctional DNA-formamidopyrimidine glycosylase/DNA-(apurinic or apyrimidinic site) lyase [Solirubrobacteraceae bacterium]